MRRFWLAALVVLVPVGMLVADSTVAVRNTDANAVLCWWSLPADQTEAALWVSLEAHRPELVFPGERRVLAWPAGTRALGVFVPQDPPPGYLTELTGAFITGAQVPAQGTLQLNRAVWTRLPAASRVTAPLQAFGLIPPNHPWAGKPWDDGPLIEWGPAFAPGGHPWDARIPRLAALSLTEEEGQLWFQLKAGSPWSALPKTLQVSLVLRSDDLALEVPLSSSDRTVWLWSTDGAQPVGWSRLDGPQVQASVGLGRLPGWASWAKRTWTWALAVTEGEATPSWNLGPMAWEDLR